MLCAQCVVSAVSAAGMANNLVKWWRTKFLNGYKQFSVVGGECGESRVSDTEELLGKTDNEEERTRDSNSTPPPLSSPNKNSSATTEHQLNLEEFSCDVSVEGGLDKSGQERQEFSFTLYDFDGHGKITKDDIAGLVTTIYETLGSSVKVPHYGSKTIKVKLTVSPDQRKRVSATVIDHRKAPGSSDEPPQHQEDNVRYKRDLNVTISRQDKRRHCKKQRAAPKERRYCFACQDKDDEVAGSGGEGGDYSDLCSQLSAEGDDMSDEGECSEDQMPSKTTAACNHHHNNNNNNNARNRRRYQKHHGSPKYRIANNQIKEQMQGLMQGNNKTHKMKKRSSSLQRQELLEIIQANMDKNNLTFQTARKPFLDHNVLETTTNNNHKQHSQQTEGKTHHHHSKHGHKEPLQYLANMVDQTHCYVDLATLQATTSPQQTKQYCGYDKLLGTMVCVPHHNRQPSSPRMVHTACKNRRHYRSKSHDLTTLQSMPYNRASNPADDQFPDIPAYLLANVKAKTQSKVKFPQMVLGHTSSPHHLRHRNRQEDQARAMAQVVRWLEQEFSSNLNTNVHDEEETLGNPTVNVGKQKKCKSNSWSYSNPPQKSSQTTEPTSAPAVERHEHHHVHEHIHHHYHHYQETPVVLV